MTVLDRILATKREELTVARANESLSSLLSRCEPSRRSLHDALSPTGRHFILEVKKASPSRGQIRPDLDVGKLVSLYDRHADAISVLTDSTYFGGGIADLVTARRHTDLPILRKDFIIDPWQLAEARANGADAALLIAAALDDQELADLADAACDLDLDLLFEVHDELEVERVLRQGARIIGVNSRNLKDLTIDPGLPARLEACLPTDVVMVSESGILSRRDVLSLPPRSFLIGSAILASSSMADKIAELVYGRTKVCGICSRHDADLVLACGAGWLGFVFHESSPRGVTPEMCAGITRGLGGRHVGVFVDQTASEIVDIARRCGLHGVQLHGRYDEAVVRRIKSALDGVFIILAIEPGAQSLPTSAADYFLLDTKNLDDPAGSLALDLSRAAKLKESDPEAFSRRVILAGGLDSGTAPQAAALEPFALDLASGVESAEGIKDAVAIRELFAALRDA